MINNFAGDTWIYGVPTDSLKMTLYREILRVRVECDDSGMCQLGDPVLANFTRFLVKLPEHTVSNWQLSASIYFISNSVGSSGNIRSQRRVKLHGCILAGSVDEPGIHREPPVVD